MNRDSIKLQELVACLDQAPPTHGPEWYQRLDERKRLELEFHNQHRDHETVQHLSLDTFEQLRGNKKYYSTTQLSVDYAADWIRDHARGKVVLDYACGEGANAIHAARSDALMAIGIDISDVSVRNAIERAREAGVSANTRFVQADCENTGLPDESIDTVVCSGMLHHLDLACAFPELHRVLKPGGVVFAIEALDYNPIIRLYRYLTPQMRTDWEKAHILSYKDLQFARRYFDVQNVRHWHLFSIAGVKFPGLLPVLNQLDEIALSVPLLKLMSWMFTFELRKPN